MVPLVPVIVRVDVLPGVAEVVLTFKTFGPESIAGSISVQGGSNPRLSVPAASVD